MEQNKESTYIVNLSLTMMQRTHNGERFGEITVLGKLDSYMQNNEIGLLSIHKN